MKLLIIFIVLSIVNVVFSTIRSITTIKSGKAIASLISGGYFAFYNIMLIYTVMDFPMWQKCVITFVCNVIGVWVVKLVEEKMRKDMLWKIEATMKKEFVNKAKYCFDVFGIPYNFYVVNDKYIIFNIYCENQSESATTKSILEKCNAKYFASESKIL